LENEESNVQLTELDIYLAESRLESDSNFDILTYWKENQARFPVLAAMARDILCIPITTVASESSFSIGGRILNKWRS
jgi:hAT family C-terminal dimerisation region